ncbi:hypothetical protein D3C75_1278870 [compost metagenome]
MFSIEDNDAKSLVITPSSIVFIEASSSLSAKLISSGILSSSPLFLRAPVHAYSVAMELVDVCCPFKWL